MATVTDLLDASFLDHPFQNYTDTRLFYPGLAEQRRVLEQAVRFLEDRKDPAKNLGVIAGPNASGKSMLAMKLAELQFTYQPNAGHTYGLYLNTNNYTEPRHFLMAVLDLLDAPSHRSNSVRLEAICERLENSEDRLLIVFDGPPFDQEYLTFLLNWSAENYKKIQALIFLQDLYNTTANIGSLSAFLGLYLPFRSPSPVELSALLYWRMLLAGGQGTMPLDETRLLEIGQEAKGNLHTALELARRALDEVLETGRDAASLAALRQQIAGPGN